MVVSGLAGLTLVPLYWALARVRGVPGLPVRWKCVALAFTLFFRRRAAIDLKTILLVALYPLDSTRYFELDFAWKTLSGSKMGQYLDVSSPRLLYTLLLREAPALRADLINPDQTDLAETRQLLNAAGLLARCRFYDCLIEDAPLSAGSYDTITSLSVVEHIPQDRQAISKMWELLKPGGRLLLTLPCAAEAYEQYIDRDEYGLRGGDKADGVFWQRFYDKHLLAENIFSVTGQPHRQVVFGERVPGLFLTMATDKRTNRYYPFWREPYMVSLEYAYFDSVDALPGEGVIAMEFVKP
ncbi:MAG TPA: class I SAM-dependent methyltransferase [Verrucomicrobiae bacterium]|nr:class I SAM-dependent methyltransferase [Verrucomicrobiae bacterium]